MKVLWRLVPLCLVMGGLVACGTTSADLRREATGGTGGSVPAAAVPGETGTGPATGQFVSMVGLASGREEIIAFTRKALEIEARRSQFIDYLARLLKTQGPQAVLNRVNKDFLLGNSAQTDQRLSDVNPRLAAPTFEGMVSLQANLLLLDCPQTTCPIKNSLAEIYAFEIQQARLKIMLGSFTPLLEAYPLVFPQYTEDNSAGSLDDKLAKDLVSQWIQMQEFRQLVYDRWAEILQEQGIDAAKQGFDELVLTP